MPTLSRRQLLHALAAAGASSSAGRLLFGCNSSQPNATADAGSKELRTLHFHVPNKLHGHTLTLHVGKKTYKLVAHDASTRATYREENAYLRTLSDAELTHHVVDAEFSANAAQSFNVQAERAVKAGDKPGRVLVLAGLVVPRGSYPAVRAIKGASHSFNRLRESRARAVRLASAAPALRPLDTDGSVDADAGAAPQIPEDLASFVNAQDCALFAVFHHPELMSLDGTTANMVLSHVNAVPQLQKLIEVIQELGQAQGPDSDYAGWANGQWSVDTKNQKIPRKDVKGNVIKDANGNVEYAFDYVPDPAVSDAAGVVIREALRLVRNDKDLENRRYVIQEGRHAANTNSATLTPSAPPQATSTSLPMRTRQDTTPYAMKFDRDGEWQNGQAVFIEQAQGRTIKVTAKNSYYRHLGVFAAFKDIDGNVLKLSDVGLTPGKFDKEHATYLGGLDAPSRVLGIPVVGATTTELEAEINVPDKANGVAILTGGLAWQDGDMRTEYAGVDGIGAGMTLVFELGLPAFLLALGIGGAEGEVTIKEFVTQWGEAVIETILEVSASAGLDFKEGTSATTLAWKFVNEVIKSLIGGAAVCFAALVAEAEAETAAKAAEPIVGWILLALDVTITLAEITTTIVDIGLSRSCVESLATFTHKLSVTVNPDPRHPGAFPQTATQVRYTAMCTEKQTFIHAVDLAVGNNPGVLNYDFPDDIPAGGEVRVTVQFLSATGWIAGQGTVTVANLVPAGQTKLSVTITIEENKVPLTATTVYSRKKKLALDAGVRQWKAPTAPPAVKTALDCRSGVSALCAPGSITYSTMSAQVGYAFLSASAALGSCDNGSTGSQLYQIVNLNDSGLISSGAPEANLKSLTCGLTRPAHVVYELMGKADGNHYALMPASAGGYELKRLNLATTESWSSLASAPTWGRFSSDRIAAARLHPAGYVVAINSDYDKVEVLQVPRTQPAAGAAPMANMLSGRGSQRGNIDGAVAIATTFTGRSFLVLESRNQRIQALDDFGNPVDYFTIGGQAASAAPIVSEVGVTWLDMTVEATGYIYLLSHVGDGTNVNDYRLDIYEPAGAFLARTTGVAAAKLAVDFWRNVFTLDYDALVLPSGRTEPSITEWIPSTPGA